MGERSMNEQWSSERRRRETALTLLEVMVVVAIMGMMALLVTKVVMDRLEEAKVKKAGIEISELSDAVQLFYLANSFYPSTEQTLQALVEKPTSGRVPERWPENGYMPAIPRDPWGNEYDYISPGRDGRQYEIVCYGRDGVEGGEGFDADIESWRLHEAE